MLLTIAIPTYNREYFLDLCLSSISTQDVNYEKVSVIVSDNASTDNTQQIVEKYINAGIPITYIRNKQNEGADFNVAQCFNIAASEYVWILGDDEFLFENSINKIVSLIEKGEKYGIIYLESIPYSDKSELEYNRVPEDINFTLYTSHYDFFKKVNIFFTFISGNIINKGAVKNIDTSRYINSNLNQLNWTIRALFATEKNMLVTTKFFAAKQDNSGGYKLIRIFCENYIYILKDLIKNGYPRYILKVTKSNLIANFFPFFLTKMLYQKNTFNKEDGLLMLFKNFWNYKNFWTGILPIYVKRYLRMFLGKRSVS